MKAFNIQFVNNVNKLIKNGVVERFIQNNKSLYSKEPDVELLNCNIDNKGREFLDILNQHFPNNQNLLSKRDDLVKLIFDNNENYSFSNITDALNHYDPSRFITINWAKIFLGHIVCDYISKMEQVVYFLNTMDEIQKLFSNLTNQYLITNKRLILIAIIDISKAIYKGVKPFRVLNEMFYVQIATRNSKNRCNNKNQDISQNMIFVDTGNWYIKAFKAQNGDNYKYLTFDGKYQTSMYFYQKIFDSIVFIETGLEIQPDTIFYNVRDLSEEKKLKPEEYAEKILFPTWCNANCIAYYPILDQDSFKPIVLKVHDYKRPDYLLYNGTDSYFVDVKTVLVKKDNGTKKVYLNNQYYDSYELYGDKFYFALYKNENQADIGYQCELVNKQSVKSFQDDLFSGKLSDFTKVEPILVKLQNSGVIINKKKLSVYSEADQDNILCQFKFK